MRTMIVSGHPLCREALAALVADELGADQVETASDLRDFADLEPADLALFDLPPSGDPATWIAAAGQAPAQLRVLVVPERDITIARLAHANGFRGLLPKTTDRVLMVAILRLVLAGGEYFPCFEEAVQAGAAILPIQVEQLSRRQREVLAELELGRTNKEIAKHLGISVATVKLHVQAILAASGTRNRTEAVSRLRKTAS
jgi:two-component system nitrate/nitrite response regulator NarL